MYTLALSREFPARHFLTGGEWGEENLPHLHHYRVEVQLSGERLDPHNYLVDLDQVAAALEDQVRRYRDALLNSLPEFEGQNPSIEVLARTLAKTYREQFPGPAFRAVRVKVWETAEAWASYEEEL